MRASGRALKDLKISVLLLTSFLLLAVGAQAQTADEKEHRPVATILGNTGFWKVYGADNMSRGQAGFNVWYDRINRNPGYLTLSTVGISGAVGITDWMELGASFEINRHMLVRRADQLSLGQQALGFFGAQVPGSAPFPNELMVGSNLLPQLRDPANRTGALTGRAGYYNGLPFLGSRLGSNGIGTVTLGLKFNVFSESRGDFAGLAFQTYATAPTHRSIQFLLARPTQTGGWQWGTNIIGSKNIGDFAQLALNAGFRGMQSPDDSDPVLLSDVVPLGFAMVVPRTTRIQAMLELNADIYVNNHTPQTTFDARDPVDATLGFRAFITPGLSLSGGYRRPLNQFGGDKNGFVADLSYTTPGGPPPAPETISLTCSADPTEFAANQPVNLTAQGVSSRGTPLTYEWSATGGTIEGSGPSVRLKTDGLAPGNYTATVRAVGTPGVVADCTMRFSRATPPPAPLPPTVTCSADRTQVQVGEIATLTAQARSPQNRPLTYDWSTTTGRITGTGPTVRFDTTGLAPGTYSVRVRVTDDQNQSAECTVQVTVNAPPAPPPPPPPPQVSRLGECTFRLNSGRVDNVCQRMLDGVALRLRNEPDSTLQIVGFAATTERTPDRLADLRASNVRANLTSKGIAATRLQTSRGAAGTGAAARKVEVHLVPRGATFTGASLTPKRPEQARTLAQVRGTSEGGIQEVAQAAGIEGGAYAPSSVPDTSRVSVQKPQATSSKRIVVARVR